jgi:large subunit ribosomal protein L7/L12
MSDKVNKIITEVEALSVLELADLVAALEEKFGVSAAAAAPAVAAGAGPVAAGAASEPADEQTAFNVILADAGANKIAVIKALREINPNLGLKEAKDLSEKPNAEILTGANKATAEDAKAKLTAAGAKVELK